MINFFGPSHFEERLFKCFHTHPREYSLPKCINQWLFLLLFIVIKAMVLLSFSANWNQNFGAVWMPNVNFIFHDITGEENWTIRCFVHRFLGIQESWVNRDIWRSHNKPLYILNLICSYVNYSVKRGTMAFLDKANNYSIRNFLHFPF